MEDQNQGQAPPAPGGSFVALGSNMSNQPAPANQTTQALPEGVTFGDAPAGPQGIQVPSSSSAMDGVTYGDKPASSAIHVGANGLPDSPLTMQDNDSLGTKIYKGGAGLLSGAGEGVFKGAAGAADLLNKSGTGQLPKQVTDWLHEMAGDNENQSAAENIGYGGETLAEFFMGDGALKATSMAQKLEAAAKTMKIVEGSPRIMTALKIGASVMKQAALHAGEAGLVQGGQTYLRSGGDTGQAAKEAAGTGALTGALDTTLGGLGEVAKATGVAGKAADVFAGLSQRAQHAISEQGLFGPLGNMITKTRQGISDIFDAAKDRAEQAKTSVAQDYTNDVNAANADKSSQTANLEVNKGVSQASADADKQTAIDNANQALEQAQQFNAQTLAKNIGDLAEGAPPPEDSAKLLNDALDAAESAKHERFEKAINGEGGIVPELKGQTAPYKGSNLSKAAEKELGGPQPGDDEATRQAKGLSGQFLSGETKNFLQTLADGGVTKEPEAAAGPTPLLKPAATFTALPDFDVEQLIRQRQALRAAASKAPRGDPKGDLLRSSLGRVINGIDDDIANLAEKSGKPEIVQKYQDARKDYREASAVLDTNTANKLKLNGADKELTDPLKYLTSGTNIPGKLKAFTGGKNPILSPDALQGFAKTKVGQLADDAAKDPEAFIKNWTNPARTPQYLKDSFYGPELTGKIDNAIEAFNAGKSTAETQAQSMIDAANATHANQTMSLGVGSEFEKQAIEDAHNKALTDAQEKKDNLTQQISDIVSKATTDRNTALQPFSGGFMNDLAEGRVSDRLVNGKVDIQDIQNLKQAAGDKWNDIADGLFQRGLVQGEDAAGKPIPKSPEDMLEWWNSWKPDVRQEAFDLDSPRSQRAYVKAMDNLQDSLAVKKLIREGLLVGAHAATAIPGAVIGHVSGAGLAGTLSALTPLATLIGGIATSAGSQTPVARGIISKLVDYVVDHPATWKTLRTVGNSSLIKNIGEDAAALAPRSGTVVKAATPSTYDRSNTKKNVYAAAADSLR